MKRKKLGKILQERGLVDKSDLLSALYEVGQAPSFRFCPHCGMQRDRHGADAPARDERKKITVAS